MNTKLVYGLCGASMMAASATVMAKTWYVESWGEDTTECGSKTEPCAKISWVVETLADKNDKIIVGPGIYADNIDITEWSNGPLEGLKIESTAGRYGTIINAEDQTYPVIIIREAKVRIGKKGKGFTIRGSDEYGIEVDGPDYASIKIEGNQASQNGIGFKLSGDKIQIRHNIARTNIDEGIDCSDCTSANIQFNEAIGNGSTGINVEGDSSKATIRKNKVSGNFDGIRLAGATGTEKATVKDNVMENNRADGLSSGSVDNGTIQGNIITRYTGVGNTDFDHGVNIDDQEGTKIKFNLVLGSEVHGFLFNDNSDLRFEGNTVVQSLDDGILDGNNGIEGFDVFKNNNTFLNDDAGENCALRTEAVDFVYTRHFFAGDDVVCFNGSGSVNMDDSTEVDKPFSIKVNTARSL